MTQVITAYLVFCAAVIAWLWVECSTLPLTPDEEDYPRE